MGILILEPPFRRSFMRDGMLVSSKRVLRRLPIEEEEPEPSTVVVEEEEKKEEPPPRDGPIIQRIDRK
jgi:hypothetical protein